MGMYSIAFDLGTTSLEAFLCDLTSKKVISFEKRNNPQQEFGMDVLSRVTFSTAKKENARILAKSLEDAIESMILGLLSGVEGEKHLLRIVFVGNPVILGTIRNSDFSHLADEIIIPPSVGGYVGADALMASYMVEQNRRSKISLMIDIGTNTEIVLLSDSICLATSAASGPAFEGANISHGMLGGPGAIDKTLLTNKVNANSEIIYHVIENDGKKAEAKGICGSGLLDVVRDLLNSGAIDNTGYISEKQNHNGRQIPPRIFSKIKSKIDKPQDVDDGKTPENTRFYELTDKIVLTQEDIRNLQLAISAIRSGVEILILKSGLTLEVIDEIKVAGNFGSHLDPSSVIRCGLLPGSFGGKMVQSGNLAGLGACELALGNADITDVIKLKNRILTVSLANESMFQELFVKYMNFPKDPSRA